MIASTRPTKNTTSRRFAKGRVAGLASSPSWPSDNAASAIVGGRDSMTRIALRTAALLGIALASLAAPVEAQYGPGASGRAPYAYQGRSSNQAGRFDYYAL